MNLKSTMIISIITLFLISIQNLNAHEGVHDQIALLDGKISNEESYSLYLQRAHLNFEATNYEEALADLDKASKLGPIEPLMYEYGNVYAGLGEYKKALENYTKFMNLNPNFPRVYQERAKVFVKLNKIDDAIKDLEKSFTLEKNPNPGYFIEAANLILQSEKSNGGKKALELLDKGMAQLNILGVLQEKAIEIEILLSNFKMAKERMFLLGKELNYNPFWRVNYASIILKSGDKTKTLEELEIALEDLSKRKNTPAVKDLLVEIETIKTKINDNKKAKS